MRPHAVKHMVTETLALAALVSPLAVLLAALIGLTSWTFGGLATGLQASWITWSASMSLFPIALRFFCGPDTRVICGDCATRDMRFLTRQAPTRTREQRRHARHPVKLPATFANARASGYAIIENVSQGGCKITTRLAVACGDSGRLLINLPGCHAPVTVSTATVRWVAGNACGLEFIGIDPQDRGLLNQVTTRVSPRSFGTAPVAIN